MILLQTPNATLYYSYDSQKEEAGELSVSFVLINSFGPLIMKRARIIHLDNVSIVTR